MKLFITITLIQFHFLNCAFENKKETPEPSKPETTQNESEIKKNGFNDTLILKNGTVLNGVKATPTNESLVVTNSEGETYVYNKKEVKEVKKAG